MRLLLVLPVLLCVGCTTTTYTKHGASTAVYEQDEDVCQSDARWLYLFHSESRYRDCMKRHGYAID